ncbi:E3 ubiquitin/ISG15 ligase TRIM25 [Cololabis saira]|uniref:E3 ubiquitin/ISG15 ligase TRIM25 n=1 Tax=Cololabis saira TaxID=129043 RepID=UPI002AD3AD56|nr:E3 ubiquitin/ISG15 ligase TRIM25 [Cololabis saira]XP_061584635.1 E3 ubiquitin/ISG15 ligase TRIM25 [Cololabis saira]
MSACKDEDNISPGNHPEDLALELTCPMCLQLFSEPVSLPCGHIYCSACLQTMGEGLDQHSCPDCHAEYQGTTPLQKNVQMCAAVETYKAGAGKIAQTPSRVTFECSRSCVTDESDTKYQHDVTAAEESQEDDAEDTINVGCNVESGSTKHPHIINEAKGSRKDKMEMKEPKFKLASQVTELHLKLEMAEGLLKKEKKQEFEVTAANSLLKEEAAKLLGQIECLVLRYSKQVTQMIEEELRPGEASVHSRVGQVSELTKQLRQAVLRAESLLTEEDETAFNQDLQSLQPCIVELLEKPVEQDEELVESKVNPARVCPKVENMNNELRKRLSEIQRSLRNTLNPSEVTFDPETVHPNLLLSEDLKTVTFCSVKQSYPLSPQRFTSFFQVLSTQSFFEGDHCWDVELEGSPWIVGVCHSDKLPRSGLPSALESNRSSWCLMWFNNLLTAFEQGQSVPLKRTTVSPRLEIKLSFKTHRLSFHNVSPSSGKTHIYTFKANLNEPVHLAYRMMSGDPKARVTIYS